MKIDNCLVLITTCVLTFLLGLSGLLLHIPTYRLQIDVHHLATYKVTATYGYNIVVELGSSIISLTWNTHDDPSVLGL